MRKHISVQLIIGFLGIVFAAILVVGLIFIGLYQRAAIDTKKADLLNRARNIAPLAGSYLIEGNAMRGMGGFFRFMDAINEAQLWVIDRNGDILSLPGMGNGMDKIVSSADTALPSEARSTVASVLSGQETTSESFSNVIGETTLSVGVPIKSDAGIVEGGIFLHTAIKQVNSGLTEAYRILFLALGMGMLVALLIAIWYSMAFTKPLVQMNRIAHLMATGQYQVRTELNRYDEFGQLGHALDNLAVSLAAAEKESTQLEQMRKDFVANVSHEFRTPLTIIQGSIEALMDGTAATQDDKTHRKQAILAETNGLNRLVGDLLELSRLESGKIKTTYETVWLNELLDDVTRSLYTLANRASIKIIRDVAHDLPPFVTDYGRFRQLFLIFLDNAIRHTPAHTTVTIQAVITDHNLIVHIDDEGAGIPEADLSHVWERFYTVEKSREFREGVQKGTGLGLPIARQLAQLLNGHVQLERLPEKGTRAVIHIPVNANLVLGNPELDQTPRI